MAFDAFLKIQTIKGDSVSEKFRDWIVVESFSWGEERPPNGAGGVAVPLEVQLVTNAQSSSANLFAACASGENLGTVNLHLVRAGELSLIFMKWDLDDAVIGSYRLAGNTADTTPADQFSIAFSTFTYAFTAQDAKGGATNTVTKTVTFGD